ncbi:uncharacterized protein K02A2.6-like [Dreissena polymorpha]|uniref:uncharacterized protein K02A2.6-like n=1 Tax=Dreissena polymorpha TaxID=45954 RepID=UPI002265535F|nr:uncharacterized protein K02A2.6-like [Dreissena polymorpha]
MSPDDERILTSPAKPSEKTYKELCDLLSTHLSPKPLIMAERFRFHKRNQATGKCIKDYVATLGKIKDIFANLSHGQKYSKLDLRQAYLQLEVDDDSKELLTINAHQGLYWYNRCVYGISSLPAIWQRTIDQILQGIPGVQCILDDMIVTEDSDQSHLDNLEKNLCRLNEFGLKLNKDKCVFFEDRVTYCGHEIDKYGLWKCNDKVQAVIDTPTPKDGRGGKGAIFTWAGGNGGIYDDCGCDGHAGRRYTISVTAVGRDQGPSWYSEVCSSVFVGAYSGNSPDLRIG